MSSEPSNLESGLAPSSVRFIPDTCARAERMIDAQCPIAEILACLANAAQAVSGVDSAASILVLDDEGLLRNGASPSLPADYLRAIDGIKPAPNIGTCAAAAATGLIVITPSFLADDKWAELRHLPLALGYVSAWSMPIKRHKNGVVLGTFGTYYRESRQPDGREMAAVTALAAVAAIALDRTAHSHGLI